jgi:hypothetical protein
MVTIEFEIELSIEESSEPSSPGTFGSNSDSKTDIVSKTAVAANPQLFVLSGTKLIPLPQRSDNKRYVLFAFLNSQENEATLIYKRNKSSEPISQKIVIFAPSAQSFSVVNPWDALRVALGSAFLYYGQTGYSDFYSWNGLVGIRLNQPFENDRWGMMSELDYTVLTVNSNQNNWAPQLLSLRADGYFEKSPAGSPWRYRALGGLSYANIFSNGAPFGFNHLAAPALGVHARYVLDQQVDFQGFCRWIMLSSNLSGRGVDCEVSRSLLFKNLHRGEAGFKYLSFDYSEEINSVGQKVSSAIYSVFFSYSL